MKSVIGLIGLCVPALLSAQGYPGMDMAKMQEFAACMERIPQEDLDAIDKESRAFEQEIRSLCNAGQRDEAQRRAREFAQELLRDPTMVRMQECGTMMQGAMPGVPALVDIQLYEDLEQYHVCD